MLKGKLIESLRQEILRQSPNLDSVKFANFQVLEIEVAKAYNSALKSFYSKDQNLENAEFDFYSKKYQIDIAESNGVKFALLPVQPIELKRNLGIRSVKPVSTISNETGETSFIRTSETEYEVIKDLEVHCCGKKAFYYLDQNRLVLKYPINEWNLVEKVEVKLLPSFTDLAMTDNIEFPEGEMNILATLLQIMGIRQVNNLNADDIK